MNYRPLVLLAAFSLSAIILVLFAVWRRPYRLFIHLLLAGLSLSASAQNWSGILSANRAVDWSHAGLPATLPDGETTANPWTPPVRTQSGSTITPSGSSSTDLANISNALSSCTNGHYVQLGAGTFQIAGSLNLYQHSCTLRGSGPASTTIALSGSGIINIGLSAGGGSGALTSSSKFAAGSTSITINGVSGSAPAVGDIATLSQCDSSAGCSAPPADNGGLWVCGDDPSCMLEPSGNGPYAHQAQTFYVTSVSGSGPYTIGLNSPIYMPNWAFANNATLSWNDPNYYAVGVGLEDLTVYYNGISGSNNLIMMDNSYASWIKGIRTVGTGGVDTLDFNGNSHILVANNAFFPTLTFDGNIHYTLLQSQTSDSLVVNNMFVGGVPWAGQGGNTGDVYSYNLGRDVYTPFLMSTTFDHHAYSSFDLYEGNQVGNILHDDTWGTHDLDTDFRNYLSCYDAPYTTPGLASRAVAIDPYHRFMNVIGNALGTASECSSYEGNESASGVIYRIDTTDPLVASTLMRWGNVSVVSQSSDTPADSGIRFASSEVPSSLPSPNSSLSNPVPGSTSLPASFYMSATAHPSGGTGLNWWKVCQTWGTFPSSCSSYQTQPFPAAGPDVASGPYVNGHAHDIPASVAWQNLPIDTSFQKSYSVTGSSWSNGTETLTVSGLPTAGHIIGGFQLSGANSACNPSGNELLMTGSSSTTVQYALASNPGITCTGTMRFPDVRQFDERVYQADSASTSGSTTPAAPTGLVATVN